MKLSSHDVIRRAYEKGYHVTEDGTLISSVGNKLPLKIRSNHTYPQIVVNIDGKRYNIAVHRLAAYCYYGEQLFEEGIVVRHLSDDLLDVSKNNLALGTYSDNERDKPAYVRSTVGKIANSARKETRRLTMRKFDDDQVRQIKIRLRDGDRVPDIARDYGVDNSVIRQIRIGHSYKDINIEEVS